MVSEIAEQSLSDRVLNFFRPTGEALQGPGWVTVDAVYVELFGGDDISRYHHLRSELLKLSEGENSILFRFAKRTGIESDYFISRANYNKNWKN
ncbi:hypothetical protein HOC01_05410 [archaeon]|jgi:hypothetical protein|nr:hypothetical protein [archaeon]MBT6697723.1 hypothetical protein [archaeon]